jgi:hypothetical protein
MKTIAAEVWYISTECHCYDEDEDSAYGWCGGCYEDDKREVLILIERWVNNYAPESWQGNVAIDAKGMGWQRVSGRAIVDMTDILPALRVNGDYRLEVTLDGGELSAVRSSHDEPCGASFRITFTNEDGNQ